MTSPAVPAWQQLALTQRLAACTHRVLVVTPDADALAAELRAQTREVDAVASAEAVLAGPARAEGAYDCVVLSPDACGDLPMSTVLGQLEPLVAPMGCFAVFGARDAVLVRLAESRLAVYASWETGESAYCLCIVVRGDYNPLEHARALFAQGHAGLSYDLLNRIPETYLQDEETTAVVAVEKQLCLLAWDNAAGEPNRMLRFYNALFHFYAATAALPTAVEAYHCQAEFWHRIGDDAMARRLLETIQYAAPSEAAERQLQRFVDAEPVDRSVAPPPEWSNPDRTPRVLLVTHLRPDYGLDTLYDGLCAVLGDDNVVAYPWKPTLHGETPSDQAHYPCSFNRRGERLEYDAVVAQLQAGKFDLVLFGDTERHLPDEQARGIASAAGDTPFCILDQGDSPYDQRPAVQAWLGREAVTACFKREYLASVSYVPKTHPLPFSYADERISIDITSSRDGVFWAGHRSAGLRRLYLEHLEHTLGVSLGDRYDQDAYTRALRRALIGLNFFGFGFDTVRYWELPAHGCMLLSEALPIRVPHDFADGETAVFFTTLPELLERAEYYLTHPDEAAAIAARGHAHLCQYHTASARARQLLAWVKQAAANRG